MPVRHVIIGAGPAATNAIDSIRRFEGKRSNIALVSDEPAHSRMALPYWVANRIPREQTHTGDAASFAKLDVDLRIGTRADSLDTDNRLVTLSDGSMLPYDNLLIATGSAPLRPPITGIDLPGVQPLWTLKQTASLLESAEQYENPRIVMVGAGFIGFTMLNAMFKRGWSLTVVEQAPQVLPKVMNANAAAIVETWLHSRGVTVHTGQTVNAITQNGSSTKRVTLTDGTELEADIVVIATGIRANTALASDAGLVVDQGILVDDHLRTTVDGIYAAGDVAQGPALSSDDREVHPIQPTAVDHGRIAGANMAGADIAYAGSLLMNVLDICGLQNASFGNWSDPDAEQFTIHNPHDHIYRQLLWSGDRITGAIFLGLPSNVGMLTDVGMTKGIIQTQTSLGEWKEFLRQNPFDIRRPYVACGVAAKLTETTLLGQPTQPRSYRFGDPNTTASPSPSHADYVPTGSLE